MRAGAQSIPIRGGTALNVGPRATNLHTQLYLVAEESDPNLSRGGVLIDPDAEVRVIPTLIPIRFDFELPHRKMPMSDEHASASGRLADELKKCSGRTEEKDC